MKFEYETALTTAVRPAHAEAIPELISTANRAIESGYALEAYRAFDNGTLAEVPLALDAYLNRQRFHLY